MTGTVADIERALIEARSLQARLREEQKQEDAWAKRDRRARRRRRFMAGVAVVAVGLATATFAFVILAYFHIFLPEGHFLRQLWYVWNLWPSTGVGTDILKLLLVAGLATAAVRGAMRRQLVEPDLI